MKEKRTIVALAVMTALLFVFSLSSASAEEKQKFEERFDRTVSLEKAGKVELKNIAGDIFVEVWDRAEVKIEALKVSKAETMEKATENAGLVKIEITQEDNLLSIETKYPEGSHRSLNVSVEYRLTVPAAAAVDIGAVSGNISLSGLSGSIKAQSVSGNVTLTKAAAGAELESVSGNVSLSDVSGDVFLNSVSGEVKAVNVKGSVTAKSVSGDAYLLGIAGAKAVKVNVLSGSIRYEGTVASGARHDYESFSGEIVVVIPADSAFDLRAKSFSGSINSDFDISMSGKIAKNELRGTVNGGGADVNVKTFSGNFSLKKK